MTPAPDFFFEVITNVFLIEKVHGPANLFQAYSFIHYAVSHRVMGGTGLTMM